MGSHWFIFVMCLGSCLSEWVLLPSVIYQQEAPRLSAKPQKIIQEKKKISYETPCPDFHNLTMLSYGKPKPEDMPKEWEVPTADIKELIRQTQRIPKATNSKCEFMRAIGARLTTEAERQIRTVFTQRSREVRSKDAHYPSMQGALMTISILLFGVYLTKLIVKILQSHYAKYNNTNLGMLNGIRQPIMIASHNIRNRSPREEWKNVHMLHLIDKYKFRYK